MLVGATASAVRFAWDPLVPGLQLSAAWPAGSCGGRSARPVSLSQPLGLQGAASPHLVQGHVQTSPAWNSDQVSSRVFYSLVQSAKTSGYQQSRMKASSFPSHPGFLVHVERSLCGLNTW